MYFSDLCSLIPRRWQPPEADPEQLEQNGVIAMSEMGMRLLMCQHDIVPQLIFLNLFSNENPIEKTEAALDIRQSVNAKLSRTLRTLFMPQTKQIPQAMKKS